MPSLMAWVPRDARPAVCKPAQGRAPRRRRPKQLVLVWALLDNLARAAEECCAQLAWVLQRPQQLAHATWVLTLEAEEARAAQAAD
jgi:hypothetical protein